MQGWQWTAKQRKRNEANTQHNKQLELGKQNYEKRQQHLRWTKNGNEMSRWLSPNYEPQIQHNKLVKKIRTYWPVEKLCTQLHYTFIHPCLICNTSWGSTLLQSDRKCFFTWRITVLPIKRKVTYLTSQLYSQHFSFWPLKLIV